MSVAVSMKGAGGGGQPPAAAARGASGPHDFDGPYEFYAGLFGKAKADFDIARVRLELEVKERFNEVTIVSFGRVLDGFLSESTRLKQGIDATVAAAKGRFEQAQGNRNTCAQAAAKAAEALKAAEARKQKNEGALGVLNRSKEELVAKEKEALGKFNKSRNEKDLDVVRGMLKQLEQYNRDIQTNQGEVKDIAAKLSEANENAAKAAKDERLAKGEEDNHKAQYDAELRKQQTISDEIDAFEQSKIVLRAHSMVTDPVNSKQMMQFIQIFRAKSLFERDNNCIRLIKKSLADRNAAILTEKMRPANEEVDRLTAQQAAKQKEIDSITARSKTRAEVTALEADLAKLEEENKKNESELTKCNDGFLNKGESSKSLIDVMQKMSNVQKKIDSAKEQIAQKKRALAAMEGDVKGDAAKLKGLNVQNDKLNESLQLAKAKCDALKNAILCFNHTFLKYMEEAPKRASVPAAAAAAAAGSKGPAAAGKGAKRTAVTAQLPDRVGAQPATKKKNDGKNAGQAKNDEDAALSAAVAAHANASKKDAKMASAGGGRGGGGGGGGAAAAAAAVEVRDDDDGDASGVVTGRAAAASMKPEQGDGDAKMLAAAGGGGGGGGSAANDFIAREFDLPGIDAFPERRTSLMRRMLRQGGINAKRFKDNVLPDIKDAGTLGELNEKMPGGATPLQYWTLKGRGDLVKLLLDNGADPKVSLKGKSKKEYTYAEIIALSPMSAEDKSEIAELIKE